MKAISTLVILGLLGGGGYYGYTKFVGDQEADVFIVKPIDRGTIIQSVSATGTIEPITKVIVGSQVSGNIKAWYADFNDRVPAGFVLAELDPDRFQTAFNQANAEVAMAKAREEEALVRFKDLDRERKRIEKLMQTNNASENELLIAAAAADAAQAIWHASQASVTSSEAMLNAAKVDLDRTIIRSPIEGVVIARNIDLGQTVAASLQAPELFLIANNLEKMQVNANVAEADVGLLKEGRPATFSVDAHPDRTFTGTIAQIRFNATVLEGVVTYVTVIEVENPDLALRPGMTANVTFEVARVEDALRIPNAALRFNPAPLDSGNSSPARGTIRPPTVWQLDAKGIPKPIELKLGLTDGNYTQMVEGPLKSGDKIITERNWTGGRGGENRRPDMTRSMMR